MTFAEIVAMIPSARMAGEGRAVAKCPAHDDRTASLSLREENGKVLAHCFAGCGFAAISKAVGLDERDWFSDAAASAGSRPAKVYRMLEHDARVQRVNAYWRRVDELGTELRRRDLRRIMIDRRVAAGKLSMEDAMELLGPIYKGYSELEAEWQGLMDRKEPLL
jgi:hypothetical protein